MPTNVFVNTCVSARVCVWGGGVRKRLCYEPWSARVCVCARLETAEECRLTTDDQTCLSTEQQLGTHTHTHTHTHSYSKFGHSKSSWRDKATVSPHTQPTADKCMQIQKDYKLSSSTIIHGTRFTFLCHTRLRLVHAHTSQAHTRTDAHKHMHKMQGG